MDMLACTACDAFVPHSQTACPCCDTPIRRSWWRRASLLLKAAGGGAVAMTLMACYGAPPYHHEVVAPTEETEPDATYDDEDRHDREGLPGEEQGEDAGGQ